MIAVLDAEWTTGFGEFSSNIYRGHPGSLIYKIYFLCERVDESSETTAYNFSLLFLEMICISICYRPHVKRIRY